MLKFGTLASLVIVCAVPFVTAAPVKPLKDYKDHKDPSLFTRLPNYYLTGITSVIEKQFAAHDFRVKAERTFTREHVEGHYTEHRYTFDRSSGTSVSPLQIMRNYQAAAKQIGGVIMYEDAYRTTLRIKRGATETWVEVAPGNTGHTYEVVIVEREAMKQNVVADANVLRQGLAETGHVEVQGLLFDFNKSELKPESAAALKQVSAMLQANPALKVWVVGHTDNVGAAETNVALSQARAASVVRALTAQYGIAATRLAPHGAGPYAPVASNASDEGRAKNRRVELVVQP